MGHGRMVQERAGPIIKRLALPLIGGRLGTGSYNYLLNLARAIGTYLPGQLTAVVFAGADVADREVAPFQQLRGVEVVRTNGLDASQSRARLAQAILLGADAPAARAFAERAIDVAFEPAMYYGWRFKIPVIAWLPDFQHRHLPELFNKGEFWRRELGFRAQTGSNRLIMLSSEDARRDCEQFYPAAVGRTSVVRFAVYLDPEVLRTNPQETATSYGLPGHFFYLPNQFWRHKNHSVVIEALHLLKRRGYDLVVATSGKVGDSRHPQYYDSLRSRVENLGLVGQFRFLEMIPREHVIALMRACTALINPSLFEGWSTPVEEAKSLGVPMLLSNLRVHREQLGAAGEFFDPHSPTQLAELMLRRQLLPTAARKTEETAAIGASGARVEQFCRDFYCAVERATTGR